MYLRKVALGFSLVTGVLAALWPVLPWHLLRDKSNEAKCPLGIGSADGRLPPLHGDLISSVGPISSGGSKPLTLVLYTNTVVWTADSAAPHSEAFAVDTSSGRFAYVGGREGAPAGVAEEVDLQGAHVIPGLIDSHMHLIPGGLSLSRPALDAITTRQQLLDVVAAASTRFEPGGWLLGAGWDESRWGGQLPSAAWIDQGQQSHMVTPDTPVWLLRHDSHMGLANRAALRLAGVGPTTPDPPGGAIVRDSAGQPTGLLTDSAMKLVADFIPPLSTWERQQAFEAAEQHALSKGITMVHDLGRVAFIEGDEAAWQDLEEVYIPAANECRLRLRIYSFVPLTTWGRMAERVQQLGMAHPSGMLFWGGVKEFADGSLGSRTALLHEPYADQPDSSGSRTIELHRLRQLAADADTAGLQVAVHAIGDRAVDEVLDIYVQLAANRSSSSAGSTRSSDQRPRWPHRIEHAQHLSCPAVAERLAAAGVAVTPNPLHLLADMPVLQARLGSERAGKGRTYAFRTLLDAGTISAFGSDWPVVPLDALGTVYAAVHRQVPGFNSEGRPWSPEEALTVEEALAAHTAAGAKAAGLERELGSITVGKLADFVVLGGPPGDASPAVQRTYVGGQCVYGCPS